MAQFYLAEVAFSFSVDSKVMALVIDNAAHAGCGAAVARVYENCLIEVAVGIVDDEDAGELECSANITPKSTATLTSTPSINFVVKLWESVCMWMGWVKDDCITHTLPAQSLFLFIRSFEYFFT